MGCLRLSPRDWYSQNSESKNLRDQVQKSLSYPSRISGHTKCQCGIAALLGGAFISTGFALLKAHTWTLPFLPRDCGAHQNNVSCASMSSRGLWRDDNGCKTCQSLISYSQKRDFNFSGRIFFVWKDPKPLFPGSLPSLLKPQRAAPWDDRFYL